MKGRVKRVWLTESRIEGYVSGNDSLFVKVVGPTQLFEFGGNCFVTHLK